MKNLIAIVALATIVLTSCQSNSNNVISTTDSTSVDFIATDSLIESSEAHADSLHMEVEKLKSDN